MILALFSNFDSLTKIRFREIKNRDSWNQNLWNHRISRLQVLTSITYKTGNSQIRKMFSSSKFGKLHQQNTISFISFQEALVVKKAKKAMVAKARTKANVRPLTNSGMKARHRLCKTLWHHFWLKSYRLQPTLMTRV